VLIPLEYEDEYESYIYESLEYAQKKIITILNVMLIKKEQSNEL
jgi:hypothetical protein